MRTFTRLSHFLVLSFLFFGSFSAISQTITVGTGTTYNSATGYPAPYGNYYWGARHQILILASELTGNCGIVDKINSITFPIYSVNSCPALQSFEIKLGHTTNTSLSSYVTGLTSVYSNSAYAPVAGNNTHIFSNCFDWNGTSNIVVEICFNNSSYVSSGNASLSTHMRMATRNNGD
jgi:hypothetical protein